MSLSQLDRYVLSYFIAHAAQTLNIDGRFYPFGDLVMSIRSKIQLNTAKFGKPVSSRADTVAKYFVNLLIERGALSVVKQEIGNDMHQFQQQAYKDMLQAFRESDDILRQAAEEGEEFWKRAFESTT